MGSTYEMLAQFARSGERFTASRCSWGCWSMRCGRPIERLSTKRPRCRCARIERWRRSEPNQVDSITGQTSDGARVGRHPRTEHAVAALVAVDVLRVRSSSRSSTGFSIPLGRCSAGSRTACGDIHGAQQCRQRRQGDPGAARADGSGPGQGERGADRRRQEAAEPGVGSRQGGVRRKLRAVPRFRRSGRQRATAT